MDIRSIGSATQPVVPPPPAPVSSPVPDPTTAGNTSAVTGAAPIAAQPSVASQPEPSIDQVTHAVKKINTAMASQSQGIEFSVDSTSHQIVVKVVDQNTNQVLRQIPSKEALAIADSLDQTQGLLIKQQA